MQSALLGPRIFVEGFQATVIGAAHFPPKVSR